MANDNQYRRVTPEEIEQNLRKFPTSGLWWGCALLGIAMANLLVRLLTNSPIPLWLSIIITIIGILLCGNTIRWIASTKSPKPDKDEDIITQRWQNTIMWLSTIFILWFVGTLLTMDIFIWKGLHIRKFYNNIEKYTEWRKEYEWWKK